MEKLDPVVVARRSAVVAMVVVKGTRSCWLVAGGDGLVLWKVEEKELEELYKVDAEEFAGEQVHLLLHLGENRLLAAATSSLKLFHLPELQYQTDSLYTHKDHITCLQLLDEHRFVSASEDGEVCIRSKSMDPLLKLNVHPEEKLEGPLHNEPYSVAAVCPLDSGKLLFVAIGNGFELFDTTTGRPLLSGALLAAHQAKVSWLGYMEATNVLVSAGSDGVLKLWSSTSIESSVEKCKSVTPQLDRLANRGYLKWGQSDPFLTLQCVATLRGHSGPVDGAVVSGAGVSLLSYSSDSHLFYWFDEVAEIGHLVAEAIHNM